LEQEYDIVYVTVENAAEASSIGRAVVGERLAACANILSGVSSIYWWDGGVQEAGEVVMILKTRRERLDSLMARIRELHSYECPCIVAVPIAKGNPAFLEWIGRETDALPGKDSDNTGNP
jgi:periplasmic divalent cation tolerance protein